MRLAPGWERFTLPPLAIGLISLALTPRFPLAGILAGIGIVLAVLVALFFRDPDRETGTGIVAAADGRIQAVEPDGIVTFLNVHDVHVVRAPYDGRIDRVQRFDGPRRPAFLSSAKTNAGVSVHIDTAWGPQEVRLVAGLVARRAVAWVEPGDTVEKGDRIGMIRFGSRVDIDTPASARPVVEVGEKARAGETTLADPPPGKEGAP